MTLGDLDLQPVDDGTFWLDGGTMFGIVPRVIWERTYAPDALNRIELALNSLLVRSGDLVVLIETGLGRKLSRKQQNIYGIDDSTDLLRQLASHGVRPEDVDIVINTHLHLDHCGWNTTVDRSGRHVPTFPNARYVVQRGEWEAAMNPTELTRASYLKENFEPIAKTDLLLLVDGEADVAPGIRVEPISGHTRYHQIVLLGAGAVRGAFVGDVIPTTAHLRAAYSCAYDASAVEALESKRALVRRALAEQWTLFFVHDPQVRASRLQESSDDRELARAVPVDV